MTKDDGIYGKPISEFFELIAAEWRIYASET